ncbi:MAG: hypothetical protein LQ343_002551 [Gyalolechia ehrenbergii]|nr:MAG: hypothetical protein LQ343_002551 [Gyalolechia ehrenbergii]
MASKWTVAVAALLATSLIPVALSIAPIEAVGSKLFDSETGEQFYIRGTGCLGSEVTDTDSSLHVLAGVIYNIYDDLDPLSVPAQCALDAPLMITLGVNTIRVYQVDYNRTHDQCMNTFSDAGIYVMIGLYSNEAFISDTTPDWDMNMFNQFTRTLDTFANYDNLLAVTVASNVIDETDTTFAAPYIKAAIRDVKAYRDGQGYRRIPVGYTSNADYDSTRLNTQDYLVCGDTIADNADFVGLNRYSWCGNSTFTESGYEEIWDEADDYPVPIFFSGTGCDDVGNREYDDQESILGYDMNDRFSGAIVNEWRQESDLYGIVSYQFGTRELTWTAEGTPAGSEPTALSPDFYSLQSQWAAITTTGTPSSDYTPVYTSVACPPLTTSSWNVTPTAALPFIENLVITAMATASASPGRDSPATPVAGPSPAQEDSNGSSGLSTGATIAIGVVIPVVVLALAVAAFFLWWRRRKAKTAVAPNEKGPEYSEVMTQDSPSPGPAVGESYNKHGSEIQGTPVAQLHADESKFYNKHGSDVEGIPVAQLRAEESRQEPGVGMADHMGDPERELAELDAYSPPLELSNGPSVRRASRNSRRSTVEDAPSTIGA